MKFFSIFILGLSLYAVAAIPARGASKPSHGKPPKGISDDDLSSDNFIGIYDDALHKYADYDLDREIESVGDYDTQHHKGDDVSAESAYERVADHADFSDSSGFDDNLKVTGQSTETEQWKSDDDGDGDATDEADLGVKGQSVSVEQKTVDEGEKEGLLPAEDREATAADGDEETIEGDDVARLEEEDSAEEEDDDEDYLSDNMERIEDDDEDFSDEDLAGDGSLDETERDIAEDVEEDKTASEDKTTSEDKPSSDDKGGAEVIVGGLSVVSNEREEEIDMNDEEEDDDVDDGEVVDIERDIDEEDGEDDDADFDEDEDAIPDSVRSFQEDDDEYTGEGIEFISDSEDTADSTESDGHIDDIEITGQSIIEDPNVDVEEDDDEGDYDEDEEDENSIVESDRQETYSDEDDEDDFVEEEEIDDSSREEESDADLDEDEFDEDEEDVDRTVHGMSAPEPATGVDARVERGPKEEEHVDFVDMEDEDDLEDIGDDIDFENDKEAKELLGETLKSMEA